ncbi:MAG: M3 family metallopeptidase [Methylovirgula sp.]
MDLRVNPPLIATASNPLLEEWTGPFGAPPFAAIRPAHFRPAFAQAFAEHRSEIAAIAENRQPPNFENTIAAFERAGRTLNRVSVVFFHLAGADTNEEIEAIEREIAPLVARHDAEIHLNDALFARIDALFRRATLGLDAEQARVLERHHLAFCRAGAGLAAEVKARLAEIGERLAALGTQFSQNVLADENAFALVLETQDELAGLPEWMKSAAAVVAERRGLSGRYAFTLARSSIEPFLQTSQRRDLRERIFRAFVTRGESGSPTDNRAVAAEMVGLRAEQARLLGFESFAHFRLADTMAKTPASARDLLERVWTLARARASVEEAALQELATAEGGNFSLAPWDWRYYAEKLRKAEFDFDEAALKPYLALDRMIEAAFFAANRLFALTFSERFDIPLYREDARAWTVRDAGGREIGLFIGDYFARPSKHGGAWMGAFRDQEKLDGEVLPIIVNVMNFVKPAPGEACLLSFEDARTLFHEFGHALHGLLSDVTYSSLSGTNVLRDFVEFPSQLYEHWLEQREVLRRFARHHESGEPIPETLLDRLVAARRFQQGFATLEYTASALVDLALHQSAGAAGLDIGAFEREKLAELGMPGAIAMRHRLPHFLHVFGGDSYSAGYYSYLWSEVLDADGFAAFTEAGDIFDPEIAERLRAHVYAAGNRTDPQAAYLAYRGKAASPDALLRKRGLIDA